MKKHCLFIVSIAVLFNTYSQVQCYNDTAQRKVEMTFRLPQFEIADTVLPDFFVPNGMSWKRVDVMDDSFGIVDSVGYPELPQMTIFVNIPENAESFTVDFTVIDSMLVPLDKAFCPHQKILDKERINPDVGIDQNPLFYNGSTFFPQEDCTLNETFFIRDRKGIVLTILPFHYQPNSRILRIVTAAEITIRYSISGHLSAPSADSYIWESYFERLFSNYSAITRPSGTSGRILMVTPRDFDQQIGSYMAYKRNLGYAVDRISLQPADCTPSIVKAKIQQRYDNIETRPDFILLVGDHGNLPAYEGDTNGTEETQPLTDVPYAFLHGDDYMVDSYIGRWSVTTDKELQTIINKTIFMEANMHLFDKEALFIAGDHNLSEWWVRPFMLNSFNAANKDVATRHFASHGFSCQNLEQPTKSETADAMLSNPLVFVYSGHGGSEKIGTINFQNPRFSIDGDYVENSQHDFFPMMFVFACKTGNFGHSHSIGEIWVRSYHGSLSYFGSSIVSKTNCDDVIEKNLLGKNYFEEPYLGSVVAKGMQGFRKNGWINSEHHKRYTKAYNLMGDPSFLTNGWGCGHDYWIEGMSLHERDTHVYHAARSTYFLGNNTVENDARLVMTSGSEITISGEFTAAIGSSVVMKIEGCSETTQTKKHGQTNETYFEVSPNEKSRADNEIMVYPSLVQKNLYVRYHNETGKSISIYLVDVYGRVVWHKNYPSNMPDIYEDIGIGQLSSGNYFVVTFSGEEKTYSKCIIKK